MTEFELIELLYILTEDAEAQFEFWMATTIAIVVAAHTAGDRLNSWVRFAIASLYLISCAMLYFRYASAVENLKPVIDQLDALGSFFQPGDPQAIPLLRTVVVAGTTVLAIVMIIRPKFVSGKSDES